MKLADPPWLTPQQLIVVKRKRTYGIECLHLQVPFTAGELLQRLLHAPSRLIQRFQILRAMVKRNMYRGAMEGGTSVSV